MTIKIGDRLPEGTLSEFIETETEGCTRKRKVSGVGGRKRNRLGEFFCPKIAERAPATSKHRPRRHVLPLGLRARPLYLARPDRRRGQPRNRARPRVDQLRGDLSVRQDARRGRLARAVGRRAAPGGYRRGRRGSFTQDSSVVRPLSVARRDSSAGPPLPTGSRCRLTGPRGAAVVAWRSAVSGSSAAAPSAVARLRSSVPGPPSAVAGVRSLVMPVRRRLTGTSRRGPDVSKENPNTRPVPNASTGMYASMSVTRPLTWMSRVHAIT